MRLTGIINRCNSLCLSYLMLVMRFILFISLIGYRSNVHGHTRLNKSLVTNDPLSTFLGKGIDTAVDVGNKLASNIQSSQAYKHGRMIGQAALNIAASAIAGGNPYQALKESILDDKLNENTMENKNVDKTVPSNFSTSFDLQENLRQLDLTVGRDVFLKEFLESITPESHKFLNSTANADYINVYNMLSKKLFVKQRNDFRQVSGIGEFEGDSINLFDFAEDINGTPKYAEQAKQIELTQSLLQTGARQHTVTNANPTEVEHAQQQVDYSSQQQSKPSKHISGNAAHMPSWDKNVRIVQPLLSKIIYLLGGDSTTADSKTRLERLAMALGYSNVISPKADGEKRSVELPTQMGVDMFWVSGTNPFLLGHLAGAMLGYVEFDAFFSTGAYKSYYSFFELVRSNGKSKFEAMCGIKRGAKYKRTSNGSVKVNTKRSRTDDPNMSSDARMLCDIMEILLDATRIYIDKAGSLLSQYGAPYETNVGALLNGQRIQSSLCSDPRESTIMVRCDFNSSILNKASTYKELSNVEAEDHRESLKEAFDMFKLLNDAALEDGNLPSTWIKMLTDPRRYSSIFELALSFDPRVFHEKTKKSWFQHYTEYENIASNENRKLLDAAYKNAKGENGSVTGTPLQAYHRLYQYMDKSGAKAWITRNLTNIEDIYHFPPSVMMSGSMVKKMRRIYSRSSMGLCHLFLYYFLTMRHPGSDYSKTLSIYGTGSLMSNIAESSKMLMPKSLKKATRWILKGGFAKKFAREKAKSSLFQILPSELIKKALTSVTFVTHTMANLQINQNAERWGKGFLTWAERENKHFVKGGYAAYIDGIITKWSDEGYSNSIAQKLNDGQSLDNNDLKQADLHKIQHVESLKWDKYLNTEILKGFEAFLDLPPIKDLDPKSSLLHSIVKDSHEKLEKHLEDTIFFGRIIQPAPYNNKLKRFFKKVVSMGRLFLNKGAHIAEHAVWFGVRFDYDKIIEVIEKLHELGMKLPQEEMYNLEESFVDLIQSMVNIISNEESRRPPGVRENYGMPTISALYPRMSSEERQREFQYSMCYHHCAPVWRAILGFTMSTLRSPASIKTFEQTLSKEKSLNDMNKPEFVNNLRFVLHGDALLHMYDSMLPKKMKRELRCFGNGRAFYFANLLKLSSKLMDRLGYKYTANLFRVQAPYFGDFVNKWAKARSESKKKEIIGLLSLGTMATYSVLQCAEIAKHATDIGVGPQENCWNIIKPPRQVCTVVPAATIAKTATQIGIQDALSVTVLAVIGPYLFLPMGITSAWNILKQHFKIVHRLDLAASAAFKRLWRKVSSGKATEKLTKWFKNAKKIARR